MNTCLNIKHNSFYIKLSNYLKQMCRRLDRILSYRKYQIYRMCHQNYKICTFCTSLIHEKLVLCQHWRNGNTFQRLDHPARLLPPLLRLTYSKPGQNLQQILRNI